MNYKKYLLLTGKLFIVRPLMACGVVLIIALILFKAAASELTITHTGYEGLGAFIGISILTTAGFILVSIIADIMGLILFYKLIKQDAPSLYKDVIFYSLSTIAILGMVVGLTGFTTLPLLQLALPFIVVGSVKVAENKK